MTKFETIDNMHTNFVTLSEQELVETDGGFGVTITVAGIITAGKVVGSLVTIGGALYGGGHLIGRTLRP
ncbi:TPA: bacteriocin [Streptococcus suis]|nr:bacteriocin [Streptococcus suis]